MVDQVNRESLRFYPRVLKTARLRHVTLRPWILFFDQLPAKSFILFCISLLSHCFAFFVWHLWLELLSTRFVCMGEKGFVLSVHINYTSCVPCWWNVQASDLFLFRHEASFYLYCNRSDLRENLPLANNYCVLTAISSPHEIHGGTRLLCNTDTKGTCKSAVLSELSAQTRVLSIQRLKHTI